MASAAKDINWRYLGDELPAFLTLAVMPFTYSIAYGLIAGIVSYIFINTVIWLIELASFGRIVPSDKEHKEPWTYKIKGGLLPPWVTRLSRGSVNYIFHRVLPRSPPPSLCAYPPVFQNCVPPSSTDASTDVDIEMKSQSSLTSQPSILRFQSYIMPSNIPNRQKDFWNEAETVRAPSSETPTTHDGIERVRSGSDEVDVKHQNKGNDEKLA